MFRSFCEQILVVGEADIATQVNDILPVRPCQKNDFRILISQFMFLIRSLNVVFLTQNEEFAEIQKILNFSNRRNLQLHVSHSMKVRQFICCHVAKKVFL